MRCEVTQQTFMPNKRRLIPTGDLGGRCSKCGWKYDVHEEIARATTDRPTLEETLRAEWRMHKCQNYPLARLKRP